MTRREGGAWALYLLLLLTLALSSVRPRGDAGEYALMASAFAIHASPDIRQADTRWVGTVEPRLHRLMARARAGMDAREPVLLGSIHRTSGGKYYSFHFWLYSLLAAPMVVPVRWFDASPLYALVLVNVVALIAAAAYASFSTRGWLRVAFPVVFLLAGTTFYLRFTGPEVLTASAALVSTLAAMRGSVGLSLLAAGVAAAQNPGAIALAIQTGAWWLIQRREPGLPLFSQAPAESRRQRWVLGLSGLALAGLPALFFQATFGVPSLIAKHTTDTSLIGGARAFSLFFDLNQGMIVGVPGIFLGIMVGVAFVIVTSRRDFEVKQALVALAVTVLTVALAMVPGLSSHNWNSGSTVFMRYAYWGAAPLVVLLVGLLAKLDPKPRQRILALAVLLQVVLLWTVGATGGNGRYTRHGTVATFVLEHFPAAYDPDPEIFRERTLGREVPADKHPVVAWPNLERPKKILVARDRTLLLPKQCGTGAVESASVTEAGRGFRYHNGPFRCQMSR